MDINKWVHSKEGPHSYSHEVYPVSNFSLQSLPLHFLYIIFTKPFHAKFPKAHF